MLIMDLHMVMVNKSHLSPLPLALFFDNLPDTSFLEVRAHLSPTNPPEDHGLHPKTQPKLKSSLLYDMVQHWERLVFTAGARRNVVTEKGQWKRKWHRRGKSEEEHPGNKKRGDLERNQMAQLLGIQYLALVPQIVLGD